MKNYDEKEIQESISLQMEIEKEREKMQPAKAIDYGKSPS